MLRILRFYWTDGMEQKVKGYKRDEGIFSYLSDNTTHIILHLYKLHITSLHVSVHSKYRLNPTYTNRDMMKNLTQNDIVRGTDIISI